MTTQLGLITDLLLDDNYSSQSVELFKSFVENEQYDITNIREDIEEFEDSFILEYMQCQLKWNNKKTNQFVHSLRRIIDDERIVKIGIELNLNSNHIINQRHLLKQIRSIDQFLVCGFVREHSIKYNGINIPIPIIDYIIIYSFESRTKLLTTIINHDLMINKYKKTILSTFFDFCQEQEYFLACDILEDIKEINDSFIMEHMQFECHWNQKECIQFLNILHHIIYDIEKPNKGYPIPSKLFNLILDAYMKKYNQY